MALCVSSFIWSAFIPPLPSTHYVDISWFLSAALYFCIMVYIVVGVLEEVQPLWYFVFSAVLFVLSQLDYFLLSKVICQVSMRACSLNILMWSCTKVTKSAKMGPFYCHLEVILWHQQWASSIFSNWIMLSQPNMWAFRTDIILIISGTVIWHKSHGHNETWQLTQPLMIQLQLLQHDSAASQPPQNWSPSSTAVCAVVDPVSPSLCLHNPISSAISAGMVSNSFADNPI